VIGVTVGVGGIGVFVGVFVSVGVFVGVSVIVGVSVFVGVGATQFTVVRFRLSD